MRFALLFLFPFLPAFAAEPDPRPQMHAMAQEITALQKFLLSEAEFVKPGNEAAIATYLQSMRGHLQSLEGKSGPFSSDPSLRANLGLLSSHMADTERTFRQGNKPFARYMLQSSLQLCIACHTRHKVQWDFALPEDGAVQGASPLARADFLFATRQFEKGRDRYLEIVEGYPENKMAKADLQKALDALAVYYVKVKADPKGGAELFSVLAKESWLTDAQRSDVKGWVRALEAWVKEAKKPPTSAAGHLALAQRLLQGDSFSLAVSSGDRFVKRLRASAHLQNILELPASQAQKGEALYLLGQVYRRVNQQLFFRFGELYLKACVQEQRKSAIGKKCYQALERAVTEGYTGSSGTEIPADEKEELQRLQRLTQ